MDLKNIFKKISYFISVKIILNFFLGISYFVIFPLYFPFLKISKKPCGYKNVEDEDVKELFYQS
jgi:hypothetical protein